MTKDVWIMGITGDGDAYHDNSVCLTKNGKVVFAASEERYTRVKHDSNFPVHAMNAALDYAGINKSQIDHYVTSWPSVNLIRNIWSMSKVDILRSALFLVTHIDKKSFRILSKTITSGVKNRSNHIPSNTHTVYDHYLSHASSAYRTSGYDKAIVVVWDGFGTTQKGLLASGALYKASEGKMVFVSHNLLSTSMGLFYEAVTNSLGFIPAEGEGKTMGLAAYGKHRRFLRVIEEIAPKFENGKWKKSPYWPDMLTATDLKYKSVYVNTRLGRKLQAIVDKSPKDVAASCQFIIEREACKYFSYICKKYETRDIALAGGVFLNVKMLKKLLDKKIVNSLYVHPHAGDGGLALGGALELYSSLYAPIAGTLQNVYLGDSYTKKDILEVLKASKDISYKKFKNIEVVAARKIADKKVLGWFQGRAEWGPRALGNRSVLADPRYLSSKERINNHLKKRDWFMPFAPSMLEEEAGKLIKNHRPTPYMTMAYDTTTFGSKSIKAAIHVDGTTRPQTVSKEDNPKYWKVINEFYKLSGVPSVLNTSFNRHGLPIVNSPKDAIEHLKWGAIDELVMGDYLVTRK